MVNLKCEMYLFIQHVLHFSLVLRWTALSRAIFEKFYFVVLSYRLTTNGNANCTQHLLKLLHALLHMYMNDVQSVYTCEIGDAHVEFCCHTGRRSYNAGSQQCLASRVLFGMTFIHDGWWQSDSGPLWLSISNEPHILFQFYSVT